MKLLGEMTPTELSQFIIDRRNARMKMIYRAKGRKPSTVTVTQLAKDLGIPEDTLAAHIEKELDKND